MGGCNDCIFYDKKYDDIRRSGLDIIRKGKDETDIHFCPLYPDGIPAEIWDKIKRCVKPYVD